MTTPKDAQRIACEFEFDLAEEEALKAQHRMKRSRRQVAPRSGSSRGAANAASHRQAIAQGELLATAQCIPAVSRHGQRRLRQRGIALHEVLAVLDYGREQRSHGASRYFLDRRSRAQLAVEMPGRLRSCTTLDIQVVVSDDGTLVTAAHRTRRIRRDIQWKRRATND